MATDTKPKDEVENGLVDPKKKEQQEQDHEFELHQIAQTASGRIRRYGLRLKAGPKLHQEVNELAETIEKSITSLAKKARSEDALLIQVEEEIHKVEKYIDSEAKAEHKKEKDEEEREKKEKEEKEHHGGHEEHEEHDTSRHEQEKPASANKTVEEKSRDKVEELKAEIAAGIAGTAASTTVGSSQAFTDERAKQLKAEQEAYLSEAEKARIAALPPEERAKVRLEQIRNGTYKKPEISVKPSEGAKPRTDAEAVEGFHKQQRPDAAKKRLEQLREEVRSQRTTTGAQKSVRKMGRSAPAQRKQLRTQTPGSVIPTRPMPPRRVQTRISAGTSRRGPGGKITTTSTTESIFSHDDGRTYEDITEFRMRRPMPSTMTTEAETRGGSYGHGSGGSQGGGSEHGGDSGGGSGGSGGGNNRGGLGRANPLRNIMRGGLGGGPKGLASKGLQGLAKNGTKVAAQAALRNPYVLAALAVLLIVIFLILFILVLLGDAEEQNQKNACQAPAETLKATITGPAAANAGQELTYAVNITDTVAAQDITVVATIPQGQTFVRSDWAKSVVTGNTVTWKAVENLPPNSLSPPNFTFNITVSPGAANTNSVIMVDATPVRAAAIAPGGGGDQQAGRQKSTEELKSIYGADQAAVEANLVTINFQGKQVQVHKLVQGVFEKVNNEITAANTGYEFRQVGTYAWRTKNIPGQNSTELSTHSFGITMDINPDTNPYTTANTHDIPQPIVDIFKRNGFIWGGDWTPQHDWMHFEYAGAPGAVPGSGNTGGGCNPGAGAPVNANYVPPSADTCGGKYKLTSPLKMNFGDPQCNFNKDALYSQLKTEDPANADVWFNKVVPCESGYNPNAYAGPSTGTPDAAGAWGLYQMGSANPPGSPPPAPGKNGINDRGDVPWTIQTTNATTYGKKIARLGAYWACAR